MSTVGKPIECRAAVLWNANEPYSIEIVEVSMPKQGEVRVKLTSSGLCHSDLHVQEGIMKRLSYPSILGHEGAGFVESVGEGVTEFQIGDLVVLVLEAYCGECDLCLNPEAHMCRKQPRTGFQMDGTARFRVNGKDASQMLSLGTFAEYTVVSKYNVAKVNSKANPKNICLAGCCIPTGYGAATDTVKVTPESTVAVWGLGGVGMCTVIGCRNSGASRIIGIDINPRKFELAKELGATEFLNPKEVSDIPGTLLQMTKDGIDFCFVSVGAISAMEDAFKASNRYSGKTVIIGLSDMGTTMKVGIWDLLFGKKLMGTYGGFKKMGREIPRLVDKIVNGQIEVEKLISHCIPLEKINEGFEKLKSGESLRTVIDFDLVER